MILYNHRDQQHPKQGQNIGNRNDLVFILFFHTIQPPNPFYKDSVKANLQLTLNSVSTKVEKQGYPSKFGYPCGMYDIYFVRSVTVKRQPPSGMFSAVI